MNDRHLHFVLVRLHGARDCGFFGGRIGQIAQYDKPRSYREDRAKQRHPNDIFNNALHIVWDHTACVFANRMRRGMIVSGFNEILLMPSFIKNSANPG